MVFTFTNRDAAAQFADTLHRLSYRLWVCTTTCTIEVKA